MAKRRKPSRDQAGTAALATLARLGIAHQVRAYEHDESTDLGYGLEAANALDIPPERVFKTLVASADGLLVVAIVPVDRLLDLKALARAIAAKRATMADVAVAERTTGYVVGGISPIGQRQRLTTVLDSSAMEHDTVLVSAGKRGVDVELAPSDLIAVTDASVARITT